jgi:putative membrane protein
VSVVVLAQMMDRGDHMDNGNGWWWVMGIVGGLFMIALIVVLIVVLVQHYNPPERSTRRTTDNSPGENILSERFARGEIDEDEYRRRRDALRG